MPGRPVSPILAAQGPLGRADMRAPGWTGVQLAPAVYGSVSAEIEGEARCRGGYVWN